MTRLTRKIQIGTVAVGGDAPISVQSMCSTDTRDVTSTSAQIDALADAGCEIVRCAVPDEAAALALSQICSKSRIPLIADIHFDYRLAIASLDGRVDCFLFNSSNIVKRMNVVGLV